MAIYETRIFSFDKANKYAEDVMVKRGLWKWRNEIRELLSDFLSDVKKIGVSEYVRARGIYILKDYDSEYESYLVNPFNRNEVISFFLIKLVYF